eukprot:gene3628-3973_t
MSHPENLRGKASAILRQTHEDEQSVDFSVDPEMLAKLEIKKPRKGEEFSTYDRDKIYRFQLEKDVKKLTKNRGKFQDRNNRFLEARRTDPEYCRYAVPQTVASDGRFNELLNQTIPLSWQATSQPYGEIAHKRYLEYLANLPKGPSEEELRDKAQRQMDQDLWAQIITGHLEPTKQDIERAKEEKRRQELRDLGLLEDEYDMGEITLTKDELKRQYMRNEEFEKLRTLPTRREFNASMHRWHRGIYYPYKVEKGFPVIERPPDSRDDHIELRDEFGRDHNPKYTSLPILKGKEENERRFVKYLAKKDYQKAEEYLAKRKEKWEQAEAKIEKEKVEQDRNRRRAGLKGLDISGDLWQARLAHTEEELAHKVRVEKDDGHVLQMRMNKTSAVGNGSGKEQRINGHDFLDGNIEEDSHLDETTIGGETFESTVSDPYQVSTLAKLRKRFTKFSKSFRISLGFRSRKYKVSPMMPLSPLKEEEQKVAKQPLDSSYRRANFLSGSQLMKTWTEWAMPRKRLYAVLFQGEPYRSTTALEKERSLQHLQYLLDAICVDTFADKLLGIGELDLTRDEYLELMNRKRKYFHSKIAELTKELKRSPITAMRELKLIKRRLALFEEANRDRYVKQERAEEQIEMMKEIILEKEKEILSLQDTRWERFQRWLTEKVAFKPRRRKATEGKKLAHLLPPVEQESYEEVVYDLFLKRIKERKIEDRQKRRIARLAGLDWSNDLSRKTADDLVIAAECGDYAVVLDLLDKRDSAALKEIEPRIPVDAVNSDGVTATYATLFLIMNKVILDTEVDFEELGLTPFQRFVRRITPSRWRKTNNEPRMDLVLQILLSYGASLDFVKVTPSDGYSMLHQAAIAGSVEMLEWLLMKDVDVNQLTKVTKRTPLMLAAERNHMDAVMLLFKYGAMSSIHHLDSQGNNILHRAVGKASLFLMKMLLLCGANPSIRNASGELPAEKARRMNRFDVSTLLANYRRRGEHDDRSRVEFLYNTEMVGFDSFDPSQGLSERGRTNPDEEFKEGMVEEEESQVKWSRKVTLSDNSTTETTLAMMAIKKRSQSYRINKLWKQNMEESSKMVESENDNGNTIPSSSFGRRLSVKLHAPSTSSQSQGATNKRGSVIGEKSRHAPPHPKRRVLAKSFLFKFPSNKQ